jgi:hypothetical protein
MFTARHSSFGNDAVHRRPILSHAVQKMLAMSVERLAKA